MAGPEAEPDDNAVAGLGEAPEAFADGYRGKQLPLFGLVRLVRPVSADGGSMPNGARGAVVERLAGDRAYVVEFFEPRHGLMTVDDDALAAYPGRRGQDETPTARPDAID